MFNSYVKLLEGMSHIFQKACLKYGYPHFFHGKRDRICSTIAIICSRSTGKQDKPTSDIGYMIYTTKQTNTARNCWWCFDPFSSVDLQFVLMAIHVSVGYDVRRGFSTIQRLRGWLHPRFILRGVWLVCFQQNHLNHKNHTKTIGKP